MTYYRDGAAQYDRPYAEAEQEALQKLLAVVDHLPVAGDVLQLACGTGRWTPRLAARAQAVTAVDAAAEALALARARTESPTVQFVQADLFEWQPPRRRALRLLARPCPAGTAAPLLDYRRRPLAPGGNAILIDDGPAAAAYEEVLANQPAPVALRRLEGGRQYGIVKVFHDAQTLTEDLTTPGWSVPPGLCSDRRGRAAGGAVISPRSRPTPPDDRRYRCVDRFAEHRLAGPSQADGADRAAGGTAIGRRAVRVRPRLATRATPARASLAISSSQTLTRKSAAIPRRPEA
ncbi:class I SAM-dependent methyltransferase [Streptomyces monashensis]|uniref:class I SAM-dependent methyltransferase n=1 Tax=Streptomyces monashensis TaxID=1678012 RepID=UPI0026A6FE2E